MNLAAHPVWSHAISSGSDVTDLIFHLVSSDLIEHVQEALNNLIGRSTHSDNESPVGSALFEISVCQRFKMNAIVR
jgi:hypothetical protein